MCQSELEAAAEAKRRAQLVPYSSWQLALGRSLAKFFKLKEKGAANSWYARALYSRCAIPASENRDFFYGGLNIRRTGFPRFLTPAGMKGVA